MAPNVRVIEGQASWRSLAFQVLLRALISRPLQHNSDMAALRQRYERLDARHARVDRTIRREAVSCDGVAAEWISVPETRPERALLCLHGGSFAFRFPNTHAAFAARLCKKLGARALIPDYRLAPEHPFPAGPDDCRAAYRWLLASGAEPRQVVLIGDSAGGNLALVTLHRALGDGMPLPACAVLLSPAVDCTFNSRSLVDNANRDPVLHFSDLQMLRRHYVPSPLLYTHPEVSPLFADFCGFPPLLLQTGSTEMLRDEAIRTAHKAHAAGVDVELELWPETPHVFQMAPFLPEAAQAINHIATFVARRTGWQLDKETVGKALRAGSTAQPCVAVQPPR
jgi:monoterpene epsilon-lactone hydrolase